MEKVKLNEVTWFQEGPGVRNTQYTESGVKLLNVANLVNGKVVLSNTSRFISEDEAFGKYKHFLCDDGDLIIASSGIKVEYLDKKMGFVTKDMLPLCMNTSTIRFKVKDKNQLDIKYLMYFFKSNIFKDQIQKLITGSAQLNYGPSHLNKVFIKMNTMNKQKEIVNKLDKITNMIENQEKMIKKYDDLIKSQFIEMFGDPLSNNIFELQELNTVCDVRDGTHDSPKYHNIGYPLITSKNIINGGISFDDVNLISKEDYDKINQRSFVDNGDILMPMIGTIGNPVIVDKIKDFAIKNVALIKFYKDSKIDNHFLYYLMKSDSFNSYLKEKNKGGTQKFVSLGIIRKIKIITPPIELQNQFADFVKHIDKLKFRETITKLKNLCYNIFNIIQSKNLSEVKK